MLEYLMASAKRMICSEPPKPMLCVMYLELAYAYAEQNGLGRELNIIYPAIVAVKRLTERE